MDNVFMLAAVAAAIHAYSYARWLWQEGNKPGGILVALLIMLSLGVPIYRLMKAQ
ncbi:hypothetical protein [Sporomusa sp. KB1]|jgi:hypothetical protein|uniref:hypothetical protein n=1 Tax=Sporomusa sp. KB1 TaxID=943346 RepID=UPI0011AD0757|nr:hypothetical protein [Sporomusa sp. KB1]TWH51858.1 hypothetical protein Salpa_0329 [Sporomusa sp. KB1]